MTKLYPVAAEKSALEKPRIVCSMSFASAEREVAEGKLQRVYDKHVLVGYERVFSSQVAQVSPASITVDEMNVNAGTNFKGGRSRTAHLHPNALQRFSRIHARTGRQLPPEDRVELVTEKVRQFGESRLVCA